MGDRWRKLAVVLLAIVCLLQSVQSIRTNGSVRMQETTGENKATANKRSGGSGGSHGGGRGGSRGGGHGGSSGKGDGEGASGGTSNTPDGRLIPLIGGGLVTPRGGHGSRKAASSTCKCSLPIVLTTTALGSVFLAL